MGISVTLGGIVMAKQTYTVPLSAVIKEATLEIVHMPSPAEERLVSSPDVNRPGLALAGYLDYFDSDRIQILGRNEHGFLSNLPQDLRQSHVDELASTNPPAIIVTRDLPILQELRDACEKHNVPLLRSKDSTSELMAALISYLNVQLAPRITRHGVLVEVYATSLHYAPCHADAAKGFQVLIGLPAETNTDFRFANPINAEDKTLWARNKWLIAHADASEAAAGAYVGLVGENIDIQNDL